MIIGSDVWWQEGLPEEGGRKTIMHGSGGKQTTLLPAPWSAGPGCTSTAASRSCRCASGVAAGQAGGQARGYEVMFANFTDQRLYLAGPGVGRGASEQPRPMTPDPLEVHGRLRPAGLRRAALRRLRLVAR